jgi:flagellar hook-associated protein 2
MAQLGLAVDDAVAEVNGGNAQHRYISGQTRLDDLNQGQGVTRGRFIVKSSTGSETTFDITGSGYQRLEDVVQLINSRGIGVQASINDSGTGLLLTDTNGGTQALTVKESGASQAARQLGILGTAADGTNFIDGSFRHTLTVEAGDTLDSVIEKINAAKVGVTASLINSGTSTNPYRLVLSSDGTGSAGRIIFDGGQTGLNLTTFVEPQDALVYLGTPGNGNAIALTSTSNQLKDVLAGVTIDLAGTSDKPVRLTISRSVDGAVKQMQAFVSSFNGVISSIDQYTQYNNETKQKGILFGDGSVSSVRNRLVNMALNAIPNSSQYTRLSQVGFTLGSGNQLTFDETKFRAAYAADPTGVMTMFTEKVEVEDTDPKKYTGGVAISISNTLELLTDDYSGLIANITDGIEDRSGLLTDRITSMNKLLEAKRARLERQFAAMETALASLQGQQSSLSTLASIASSYQK